MSASVAALVAACASMVTALAVAGGLAVTLLGQAHIKRQLRTANGLSVGEMTEEAHARRIQEEVPAADRTHDEQGYVDRLEEGPA